MGEILMNNEMDEQAINLKDLLYRVLLQWRKIVIGAIIIAILVGLYRFATTFMVVLDPDKLREAEEQYNIVLNDYNAKGEQLRTTINNLRDSSRNQQEYNDKSVIMTIDPLNKWVGSVVIYVDSKYQIDPNLTYQNIDNTNRLISAYSRYLTGGELYKEIIEKTDIVDEIRFLTEILSVSVDTGSSSITIQCIGKSEDDVKEILDLVKVGMNSKYESIASAIGDHSCDVLMESMYTTIDLDMDARQKANLQAINDYSIQIGGTNEELTELSKEPLPKAEYGVEYSVKEGIKFIIFGGIAGILIMGIIFAAKYAVSATVKTDDDWENLGIHVLAQIHEERPKKKFLHKFDEWLDRKLGGITNKVGLPDQCKLAANNLSAVLKEKDLTEGVLTGDLPTELTANIVDDMNKAGAAQEFRYAGDILSDPEAASKLSDVTEVVLMGQNTKTRLDSIQKECTLLKAWGKEIIGVVVVE